MRAPSAAGGPVNRTKPSDGPHRFLVTTGAGLEGLLREELEEMGLAPRPTPAGPLVLAGDWTAAATVLTRSRIASRLLLSLREFSARHQAMLYDQVRRVRWAELFSPERSLAVHTFGDPGRADFTLPYAALKIKDAVCDEYRHHGLPRPDVDRHEPDVRLTAFFFRGRCELSVDLSGAPLHRRGYREEGAEAPLRENRAAALLRFAGYDGSGPLLDPFCGSGTVAVEAALIALRRAPGLLRPVEGYAAAVLFPESVEPLGEARVRASAEASEEAPAPILGSDVSGDTLAVARSNAAKAGVAGAIRFDRADAREIEPPAGWIVTNPPYGERLGDEESAVALLDAFVSRVKHHGAGARLALVVPRGRLEKSVGLRPSRRLAVESGRLGLRFLVFEIYAGSRKGRG